ncbi:MAG: MipA/OmpV family protein [Bdellovibrionota bacterium]
MRVLIFMTLALLPIAAVSKEQPKWEAGAGFGYLRFEHYPASTQYTDLAIPFPTFVYRGETLRADDREGAKIFLLKSPDWTLQFGGVLFPPLSSSSNSARTGMIDLPVVVAPGPQLVRTLNENWSAKFGVYQALAASWTSLRTTGGIWEGTTTYQHSYELGSTVYGFNEATTTVSFGVMGASQELNELYYGVPAADATASRDAYYANAGLLATQVSFFQSIKRGDLAIYAGGRVSDYGISANRASPLFETNQNIALLFGVTYSLFKSEAMEAPGVGK